MHSTGVLDYRFAGLLAHLVELVERSQVTLVDVLHVFAVDKAGQALVALLLWGEKVEPTAVDRASLTQAAARPHVSRLNHVFDDIESRR